MELAITQKLEAKTSNAAASGLITPDTAKPTPMAVQDVAQMRFWRTVRIVFFARAITLETFVKSSFISTTEGVLEPQSLALPMAMPASAEVRAGKSSMA